VKRALAVTILFFVVALALGVSFGTEPRSLASALFDPASMDREIIFDVRLPRVLLGALSGAGLACVGAAFQAVLRNPLAEPYVLGVSGGAALGATIALLAGVGATTIAGASILPLAALAGGFAATLLVYALAQMAGGARATSMLLAGVVVNAIASAAITFSKTIVRATKAQELLYWLMGFLDVPSPRALVFVGLYVLAGAAILWNDSGRLNLLVLGDEAAEHLGVDVRGLERRTFFACSLVVGAIVSVTGLIGFVGLIVPHALRRIFGADARVLIPASLFAGGGTLVLCDLASRVLFRALGTEPPVGAVTALLGGPLFLFLLRRGGRS
jgi:iron complex transport system permease protein